MTRLARALRSPVVRRMPHALCVALLVEIGLRWLRLPRLAAGLGVPLALTGEPVLDPTAAIEDRIRLDAGERARYRAALRVMAMWPLGGDGKCLRTALVVGHLLRHRAPTLHVGARRLGGTLQAHAWIRLDGRVLDPDAGSYVSFTGVETRA